eukprot:UN32165
MANEVFDLRVRRLHESIVHDNPDIRKLHKKNWIKLWWHDKKLLWKMNHKQRSSQAAIWKNSLATIQSKFGQSFLSILNLYSGYSCSIFCRL